MEYKYKAFISYAHKARDIAAAEALQTAIERYVIPAKLRNNGVKQIGRIFRDEAEMHANSDLTQNLHEALENSEYLIVICSEDAAASEWVAQEVAYFREHRDEKNILTVLTGGDPKVLFPVLMPDMPEPLYIDLSAGDTAEMRRTLKDWFLKLCAPLMGCDYDDLVMRDQKRKRSQMAWWITGIAAVASVIIGILSWSNWQIEGKNEELAQVNSELARKNNELAQQNNELLLRESKIITQEAAASLDDGYWCAAVRSALSALPAPESDRPYYAPAEQVLLSILDPLDEDAEDTVLPHDIVLEQASPVQDLCFSADGSLLISLDSYSTLTCYDAVTGESLWTRQLVTDSSILSLQLRTCHVRNSVLVLCDDTITSLSQATGEVLWTIELNIYMESCFELTDDGMYLACLEDRGSQGKLSLVLCSTEDGSIVSRCPIAESEQELVSCSKRSLPPDVDVYDFSADGLRFAGCFGVKADGQLTHVQFFVTDLTTGRTEIVYTQPISGAFEMIYGLSFSDQDTTLTAAGSSGNDTTLCTLEKISIRDHALLWQTDCGSVEYYNPAFFRYIDPPRILFSDLHTLVNINSLVYVLDSQTGQLLLHKDFSSNLILLEEIRKNSYAFMLEDGTYNVGRVSSSGNFIYYDGDGTPLYSLNSITAGCLWKEGYLSLLWNENGGSGGVFAGTKEEDFGCIAFVPADNDRRIVIRRAVSLAPELGRKELLRVTGMKITSFHFGSDNTLSVLYQSNSTGTEIKHYYTFDRETLEQTDFFSYEHDHLSEIKHLLTPDGSGLIYATLNDDPSAIVFCDIDSRSRTMLSPIYDVVPFRIGDTVIDAEMLGYCIGRLSGDQGILSVCATDHGLKLWINDSAQEDVLYPRELELHNHLTRDQNLIAGPNGYVLLDLLYQIKEPVNDSYHLYSIHDKQWYAIPFGAYDIEHHVTSLGQTKPWFAVMDSRGVLRCQDIPTGNRLWSVQTGLSPNSVKQLQWIAEDRYLMLVTEENLMHIIDGLTGETLLEYGILDSDVSYVLNAAVNTERGHLYVWPERNEDGICVDLESRTILAAIPEMRFYDPVSDLIYQEFTTYDSDYNSIYILTAARLLNTGELVELGKAYLGE